jgi:hypothetical protein
MASSRRRLTPVIATRHPPSSTANGPSTRIRSSPGTRSSPRRVITAPLRGTTPQITAAPGVHTRSAMCRRYARGPRLAPFAAPVESRPPTPLSVGAACQSVHAHRSGGLTSTQPAVPAGGAQDRHPPDDRICRSISSGFRCSSRYDLTPLELAAYLTGSTLIEIRRRDLERSSSDERTGSRRSSPSPRCRHPASGEVGRRTPRRCCCRGRRTDPVSRVSRSRSRRVGRRGQRSPDPADRCHS